MTENRTPGFGAGRRPARAACASGSALGNSGGRKPRIPADRSRAGQGQDVRGARPPSVLNSRYDAGVRPTSGEKIRAERSSAQGRQGGGRAPRGAPRAAAGRKTQCAAAERNHRDSAPHRREPITVQQRRTQDSAAARCRRCACPGQTRVARRAIDPNQQHDQEYGFSGHTGRAASASAA